MRLREARGMITLLMLLSLADARNITLQTAPVPVIRVPEPSATARVLRDSVVVDFVPGEVRCEGATVAPRLAVRPVPVAGYASPNLPTRLTVEFRIDEAGRPLSIGQPQRNGYGHLDTSDVAPALAAWQFAAGAPRSGCKIGFTLLAEPIARAPAALLHRAFALPHLRQPAEKALIARFRADDGDCAMPRPPAVLRRSFPDFAKIAQAPGTHSYAMVGFDIDAQGKPHRIRIRSSDGNAELDRASIRAIGDSRFVKGARTGCSYPFHRRQSTPLPAPMLPPSDSFRPANATCPRDWTMFDGPPPVDFPDAFGRRSIEGVALVRYDVAPWGAVGNLKILAAEPAAVFGETAQSVLARVKPKAPEGGSGYSGCIARVVFRLPG